MMESHLLWISLFILPCYCQNQNKFVLEGSSGSYAQLPGWVPCRNGTLSLEFKTKKEGQLLLYMDTGHAEYFQVKMVRKVAVLRWSLGQHLASVITAGHDLSDNKWHELQIRRDGTSTFFRIDNLERMRSERSDDIDFGESFSEYYLYLGGLPKDYDSKDLANPFVTYEPRFRGSIRNLKYSNCGGPPQSVDILSSQGVRETEEDPCNLINPCLHGGMCVGTDMGALCDCSNTGHEGQFCERVIIHHEATFFGSEYVSFDLSEEGEPVVSTNDKVTFRFKTQQANGLLFYTGDGSDFLVVALLEGGLLLRIMLLSGSFEAKISPELGFNRLDDNRWHQVTITRQSREVTLALDQNITQTGTIVGDYTLLSSRVLYVGGSPSPSVTGDVRVVDNFRGCLQQVIYTADSVNLDLLRLAQDDPNLITSHGNLVLDKCQDVHNSQPITFSTEDALLIGPKWNAFKSGSFSFQFRTNEPNGLLLYGRSVGHRRHRRLSDERSFFALEMLDGFIYFIVNLGYGVEKIVGYEYRLDDSLPHRVTLTHHSRKGTIEIDGKTNTYKIKKKNHEQGLSFDIYMGGPGPSKPLPYQVWTAMLKQGYVGCMQDLKIDGTDVDLVELADSQNVEGIEPHCRVIQPLCSSFPCLHNGECRDGWNRYVCDCSGTGFTGPTCEKPALTLKFDGNEFLELTLPDDSTTEAEDISLRFRTQSPEGLLFMTSSQLHADSLMLELKEAQVTLTLTLDSQSKSLTMGQGLDDDRWHTAWIKRRAQRLEMRLDNSSAVQEILDADDSSLHVDSINFGSPSNQNSLETGQLISGQGSVGFNKVHVARRVARSKPSNDQEQQPSNFEGEMEQFMFNDNPFFDMVRTGNIQNIKTNAEYSKEERSVRNPITFKTTQAYLIAYHQIRDTFSIFFSMKTTQPDGLILYIGAASGNDFLAMELSNGRLQYIFDVGSGPRVLKANLRRNLNDNRWHLISIIRPALQQHILRVDDSVAFDNLPDSSTVFFDTDSTIYIGGVDNDMFNSLPDKIKARVGFQGCLGSLDMDGDTRDILRLRTTILKDAFKADIVEGCEGPKTQCSPSSCENGGVCIQEWNNYKCDCDMTSFTGDRCQEDGIAYKFGSAGGLIHYAHQDMEIQNSKRDMLALGFMTKESDAILVRINSRESKDFIEMELVNGNIFVVYNMGTMDHPIGQLFDKVDDGAYHVVRFIRDGANASLQIDSEQIQFKTPTEVLQLLTENIELSGTQLSIFNKLGDVYIGGRKDSEGRIVRPFSGTIAGLVLNGTPLLEKAAEGDARVTIEGDVQLQIQPLNRASVTAEPATSPVIVTPVPKDMSTLGMQSTMGVKTTPKGTGVSDDIIIVGPDCEEIDAADCPDYDPNALISPKVIFKTTQPPSTTPSPFGPLPGNPDEPCGPDDDEDCNAGSGSGYIIDPVETPKTVTGDEDKDPIDIDTEDNTPRPEKTTTDEPKIFVDVNMTQNPFLHPTKPQMAMSTPDQLGGGPGGSGRGAVTPALDPLRRGGTALGMNIGLIIGIAVGVVLLLLVVAFLFYKCKSRDEGSYKIDESKNYSYETCNTKPPPQVNGGMSKSGSNCSKSSKKKDVKEWYV